ncbi:MAG: hypothetical protein AB1742_15965 [bacterium]
MTPELESKYCIDDFEPYFKKIMFALLKLKKIVLEEAVAPSEALFADYNKIVSTEFEQLESDKDELRASLEKTRGVFEELKEKMNKIEEPAKAPFALRITLSASREKGRKHVLDSLNASRALLRYLDAGDTAELGKAREYLMQTTFAAKVGDEPPPRSTVKRAR